MMFARKGVMVVEMQKKECEFLLTLPDKSDVVSEIRADLILMD